MDEAEKYQQRLEAIAEKRRLQEEQDKARREMEDERLRLQQLKRKSLRDQWLMEGPSLSPTSPNSQSPRSPLWGSPAQETEQPTDKLEPESQRLAEEEEKPKEQMEDGQTEAVKAAEAGEAEDIIQDVVLQNGENNPAGIETEDGDVKTDLLKESEAVLTNGEREPEVTTNHRASEDSVPPTSNGPAPASEDEPELNQGEAPHVNIEEEEEEEEGTLVMRAERVIITDEGEDVPEDQTAQQDQQDATDLEETPLKSETEAGEEGEAAVEVGGKVVVTEVDPESFSQPEAQPQTEEEVTREDVRANEKDSKAEEQDEATEEPTSVQPQCQVDALEGATVALVPVYSEASVTLTPNLEAEGEAEEPAEATEAAIKAEDPAPGSGQFQEVPLVDPHESSEAAEQDPLLSQAKDPDTQAEISAAANSLSSIETPIPSRAGQEEETQAKPKRKSCKCCSVM